MATFSLENFGCRATEADAAAMRRALRSAGWTMLEQHASAEVVVLNTCTVTSAADSQARDAVRKIHRANPAARILVTGCYAQRAPEDLAQLPGVSWVVGNSHQTEIPGLLRELLSRDVERGPRRQLRTEFLPCELLHGAPSARFRSARAASIPNQCRSRAARPKFSPETFSRRRPCRSVPWKACQPTARGPS